MGEEPSRIVRELLPSIEPVQVSSFTDFLNAPRDAHTVSFVDTSGLTALDADAPPRIIVITGEPLPATIGWLANRPWLSHVVSTQMLQHPLAAEHLGNAVKTLSR